MVCKVSRFLTEKNNYSQQQAGQNAGLTFMIQQKEFLFYIRIKAKLTLPSPNVVWVTQELSAISILNCDWADGAHFGRL
jgi:hypothetical protein